MSHACGRTGHVGFGDSKIEESIGELFCKQMGHRRMSKVGVQYYYLIIFFAQVL